MSEEEIIALRRHKLERLRSRGIDPYPVRVQRTHSAKAAVDLIAASADSHEVVTVAGRVTAFRRMGKAAFLDLRDGSGRIQAYFKQERIGVSTSRKPRASMKRLISRITRDRATKVSRTSGFAIRSRYRWR